MHVRQTAVQSENATREVNHNIVALTQEFAQLKNNLATFKTST